MVEVLGVHVGDHGDDRRQAQETAVALVGLDHHPVAGAEPRVGAVGVDDAAVDHGGVEMRRLQHRGDQAGGGGLAVRAADRDRPFQPHQFGQHLGPPHHRDQPRARRRDLGIVALHRGGHHDNLRAAEIGRVMADGDRDAGLAQAADIGGIGDVAALHRIAEVVQHLGDTRHADAADADEMDRADGEWQSPHGRPRRRRGRPGRPASVLPSVRAWMAGPSAGHDLQMAPRRAAQAAMRWRLLMAVPPGA